VFCWRLWKVDFNRRECTAITKNLSNLVRIYSSFLNAISFNWTIFLLIFTSNITAIFLMNLTTIILFTNAISYFNTLKKLNNLETNEKLSGTKSAYFSIFLSIAICNTREWIAKNKKKSILSNFQVQFLLKVVFNWRKVGFRVSKNVGKEAKRIQWKCGTRFSQQKGKTTSKS
jgi:hypothetical protein